MIQLSTPLVVSPDADSMKLEAPVAAGLSGFRLAWNSAGVDDIDKAPHFGVKNLS
jgi:hypothetical protein